MNKIDSNNQSKLINMVIYIFQSFQRSITKILGVREKKWLQNKMDKNKVKSCNEMLKIA